MVKPIISYGSSILTKVCNPVSNSVTAVDLIDTLKNTNGVGLAAPQIGLLEQIFITKLNNNIQIYINPIIRNRYKEQLSEEGCLSIPTIYGKIKRADIIDIEYYDGNMNKQTKQLKGFESIVFQHEYDHLAGILFIDYFGKDGIDKIKSRLDEIESGKIKTNYIMC